MLTRQQPKKCDKKSGGERERGKEAERGGKEGGMATTGNEKGKTGRTKVKNQFVAN